jgi:hypothetical protein
MTVTDTQTAHGTAVTGSASRYLQQLCKHWSHKADATFDAGAGRVEFESGNILEMTASDAALDLKVTVPAGGDLAHFKTVVDKHLIRFAFREDLGIDWDT